MSNTPAASLGASLKYYDAADANPATVLGLESLDPPAVEVGTAETTTLASTARRRIATIPSYGPVNGKLRFDSADTTHGDTSGLRFLCTTKARRKFEITLNDTGADVMTFFGYVTKFDVDEQTVDGVVGAMFEITIDGAVTYS